MGHMSLATGTSGSIYVPSAGDFSQPDPEHEFLVSVRNRRVRGDSVVRMWGFRGEKETGSVMSSARAGMCARCAGVRAWVRAVRAGAVARTEVRDAARTDSRAATLV